MPDGSNIGYGSIDRVRLIEEVVSSTLQGAERAAKHALAQVCILSLLPSTIESLLSAIVDTRNTQGAEVKCDGGDQQVVAVVYVIVPGKAAL